LARRGKRGARLDPSPRLCDVPAGLKTKKSVSEGNGVDEAVVPLLDPGRGLPSRATFGRSPATIGHKAAVIPRWGFTTRRRGGVTCTLRRCSAATAEFFHAMASRKLIRSRSGHSSIALPICSSHVRRGLNDLAKSKAPIAVEILKRIAALYGIEERVRGKSATEGWRCVRRTAARPSGHGDATAPARSGGHGRLAVARRRHRGNGRETHH
jgi:hypothetical protein